MKKHNTIIYKTRNYELFERDPVNRATDENSQLFASMKKHGWIEAYPAFVVPTGRGTFRVKDGQHRIAYAKDLGLPVLYVTPHENGIAIPELNNTQRRWSLADYITSYANQGNEHYKRLLNFQAQHGLPLSVCANLLSGCVGSATASVKRGLFKIKSEDHAARVCSIVSCASTQVKWSSNTYFISAISLALKYSNLEERVLCEKIRKHPALLILMPTVDDFLEMIEKLYNHCSRNLISIRHAVRAGIKESQIESGRRLGGSK